MWQFAEIRNTNVNSVTMISLIKLIKNKKMFFFILTNL